MRLTGRHGVAWLAGLLFGFSPFVIARTAGHLSLVSVAPLAAFWLSIDSLRQNGAIPRGRWGRAPAWRGRSTAIRTDLVYCVMLAAIVLTPLSLSIERRAASGSRPLARALGMTAAAAATLAAVIWATGGWTLHGRRPRHLGAWNPQSRRGRDTRRGRLAGRCGTAMAPASPGSAWAA